MSNNYFQFKQFRIHQDRCAMKVTTDSCLFGGWIAEKVNSRESIVDSEGKPETMLDIGAGTGLLSLMLAQKSSCLIDAIELDKDAFEQASENIAASPWKHRITLYHADVGEFSFPSTYQFIVSNPPFYENELKSADKKKNISHHDEGLSLDTLLLIIKNRLSAIGRFYLLLPYKRKTEIEALFKKNNLFFVKTVSVRQSVNHDYFRLMIEGSLHNDQPAEETELSIWDKDNQYTGEFTKLLKDYYLHL